jgi:hypothetical protein
MSRVVVGHRVWAIAEGYIPGQSVSSDHALVSHETACILNSSDEDAEISITLFFTDREPCGPYPDQSWCASHTSSAIQRSHGSRTGAARYELRVSDRIDSADSVQHTRLDSRNPNIALLSTVAFAA